MRTAGLDKAQAGIKIAGRNVKTIVLTRWAFVGEAVSLLFNMLSKLVITFLPRSKRLFISWLQYFWSQK